MNENSITDAARWIVDQHSQKKNYANLPESFGIGGLDDAYLVQQEVVGFFQNYRGRIGGHKLALTSKPIQQLCGLDHPCAGQLFHSEIHYGKHDLQLDDFLSVGIEFELAFRIAQDMTSIQGPWNRESSSLSSVRSILPSNWFLTVRRTTRTSTSFSGGRQRVVRRGVPR